MRHAACALSVQLDFSTSGGAAGHRWHTFASAHPPSLAPPPPHASPPGCNLAAPDSYFDTNDAAAAKAFAAANATMYGNADAVIVGFSAAGPKDVLFT